MRNLHLGIIGGGQLGMLLVQKAIEFPVHVSVFDANPKCPAAPFTHRFVQGEFGDFDAVYDFGQSVDVLIYEIEKTNVEALLKLESEGKRIFSSPTTLQWIQDKGVQRAKLAEHGFPQPLYELVPGDVVRAYDGDFPVVQKIRTGGYDGQGVIIHRDAASLAEAPEIESMMEEMVDIEMELSVLVARTESINEEAPEVVVYPVSELTFTDANLVDLVITPARVNDEVVDRVMELAAEMADKLEFKGIYAIELFLTKDGRLLVNEISPRPHNSGHHTVSANVSSQYEQQIRMACSLPLGEPTMISPSIMLNLVGEDEGATDYQGIEAAYKIPHVQYTFYGKDKVRKDRKMGHAVVLEEDLDLALERVKLVKQTLSVRSSES